MIIPKGFNYNLHESSMKELFRTKEYLSLEMVLEWIKSIGIQLEKKEYEEIRYITYANDQKLTKEMFMFKRYEGCKDAEYGVVRIGFLHKCPHKSTLEDIGHILACKACLSKLGERIDIIDNRLQYQER